MAVRLEHFSPRLLIPDLEVRDLSEINVSDLREKGIRGFVFDVDGTLGRYHCKRVHPNFRKAFHEMTLDGMACIISNTYSDERKAKLGSYFGLHVVKSKLKKPAQEPFLEAAEYLQLMPSQIAMVGDRLLTDIAGAKSVGMYAIKVQAHGLLIEPLAMSIPRAIEQFVLACYKEELPSWQTHVRQLSSAASL